MHLALPSSVRMHSGNAEGAIFNDFVTWNIEDSCVDIMSLILILLLSSCCYPFYIAVVIAHGRVHMILHHCDEIERVVVFTNFSSLSHGIE